MGPGNPGVLRLFRGSYMGERIKVLLLRLRRYCGRDMLIKKLQKFTIQNISLNAAIEENAALEENAAVEEVIYQLNIF